MSRRIQSVAYNAAGGGAQDVDEYTDRIVKIIPSEAVAAWVAISSLIASAQGRSSREPRCRPFCSFCLPPWREGTRGK